ncbi:MAG TPA: PAS domain S-box protein, partial [Chitinophagales bacterium]|nr:PAS domain S-box protein [Chitinophagales bacterium]
MVSGIEEQSSMVIGNPVLGIVWGTTDGRLTDTNQAFCNMVGYTRDELMGAHFNRFTHPDDIPQAVAKFQLLLSGKADTYEVEKRYLIRNNSIIWVRVLVSAKREADGSISSIMGIVQNISEQKKAEEMLRRSENILHFILSNTDSAFILLDTGGRVTMANRVADEWATQELGRTLQPGELLTGVLPAVYRDKGQAAIMVALSGTGYSYEDRYKKRDGVVGWYHVKIDSILDSAGKVSGLCITATETTRYRAAQAEIKAMNDSLEKKVKERTAELENANKELEAFTYSVSHDLMAPLRIIDGFSQVLLDDYRSKLDDDGLRTLQVIKRNATRMGELVNDLLNLARLGRANLVKRS